MLIDISAVANINFPRSVWLSQGKFASFNVNKSYLGCTQKESHDWQIKVLTVVFCCYYVERIYSPWKGEKGERKMLPKFWQNNQIRWKRKPEKVITETSRKSTFDLLIVAFFIPNLNGTEEKIFQKGNSINSAKHLRNEIFKKVPGKFRWFQQSPQVVLDNLIILSIFSYDFNFIWMSFGYSFIRNFSK